MGAPSQVEAPGRLPPASSLAGLELQLRLEDALASAHHLWVRGRLLGLGDLPGSNGDRRWWEWWRALAGPSPPLCPVHLDVRTSGSVLQAESPLLPFGRFEALIPADLPLARRGWRVARCRATCAGWSAEACGVVLEPPREARRAVVVLLPLQHTYPEGGPKRLALSEFAAHLARVLRTLEQGPDGWQPFYYLACVPLEGRNRQAELALAAANLGWPSGSVVLLPSESGGPEALPEGLDRLRRLFAGHLELLVLNLEPQVVRLLADRTGSEPDCAPVRRLVNPEDDPWELLLDATRDGDGDKVTRWQGDKVTAGQAASEVASPSQGGEDQPITLSPCHLVTASPCHPPGPRPTRATLLPRYPIVFCHGMLACTMMYMQMPEHHNYFHHLGDFLRQRGFRVLFPQVPATSGVAERAACLRDQVRRWTDEPVNLIAHSFGGLDARYLISRLGMAGRVRSLTTVGTPHCGSWMADWFLANFRRTVPLLPALEAVGINVDGFGDCRPAVAREFNAHTPDAPGVRYFSFGGEIHPSRVTPMLRRSWGMLYAAEGPNDGLVSLTSARWGEYLGTIHADHFAQTPDGLFVRRGEDWDALGFYSRLVEDLARRGF